MKQLTLAAAQAVKGFEVHGRVDSSRKCDNPPAASHVKTPTLSCRILVSWKFIHSGLRSPDQPMPRIPHPAPGPAGRAASSLRNAGTRDHRDTGTGTVQMQSGYAVQLVRDHPENEFCREMSVVFIHAAATCTAWVRRRCGGAQIQCKKPVFCKVSAGWPGPVLFDDVNAATLEQTFNMRPSFP